jgi:hypothetical protein
MKIKVQFFNPICLLIAILFMTNVANAQIVSIPDAHFKAALLANDSLNTNGDLEIQTTEAMSFNGFLNVSSQGIYSMAGIEYFTRLVALDCSDNNIISLNLSSSIDLMRLYCGDNKIQYLDIDKCSQLMLLYCNNNIMTNLNVSLNSQLVKLNCANNYLIDLDLTFNPLLEELDCCFNQLSQLDVSNNTRLENLNCENNGLSALNLANHNNLNMPTANFSALGNNLACVKVDNPTFSISNWSANVDMGVLFSTNCLALNITTETAFSKALSLYPNPTTDAVQIYLGKNYHNVTIKIHNSIGELVLVKQYSELSQTRIDLNVAAGIYLINIDAEEAGESITSKLIKL